MKKGRGHMAATLFAVTLSTMAKIYEEIIDFIAGGTTPDGVIAFQPSTEAKARFETLIQGHKNATLSPEDAAELEHFLQLEHLMRLAKARTRHRLTGAEQSLAGKATCDRR